MLITTPSCSFSFRLFSISSRSVLESRFTITLPEYAKIRLREEEIEGCALCVYATTSTEGVMLYKPLSLDLVGGFKMTSPSSVQLKHLATFEYICNFCSLKNAERVFVKTHLHVFCIFFVTKEIMVMNTFREILNYFHHPFIINLYF